MPPIEIHHSRSFTKLINMGETGSGKTGALASLAAAGYKVRILDLDNGVDILRNLLTSPKFATLYPPGSAKNVDSVRTIREEMRLVGGKLYPKKAALWPEAMATLMDWKDTDADGKEFSLGRVHDWGENCVLVIDTLTALARGAWNYHCQINGKLGTDVIGYEYQRYVGQVQQMLENFLDLIADASLKTNVIVNSHVTYVRDAGESAPKEGEADKVHGFPSAIGRAIAPRIGRVFNSALITKVDGFGQFAKHKIFTKSQGLIFAKTSAPGNVQSEYPVETGLADYFKAVRGSGPNQGAKT